VSIGYRENFIKLSYWYQSSYNVAEEAPMNLPRLKELRERAFLTQADLAQRAGVSEVTINRIENGHYRARFSTINKLAVALGVGPEVLADGAMPHSEAETRQRTREIDESC
jgi:DNA-binding XRE family transcriptional regulator